MSTPDGIAGIPVLCVIFIRYSLSKRSINLEPSNDNLFVLYRYDVSAIPFFLKLIRPVFNAISRRLYHCSPLSIGYTHLQSNEFLLRRERALRLQAKAYDLHTSALLSRRFFSSIGLKYKHSCADGHYQIQIKGMRYTELSRRRYSKKFNRQKLTDFDLTPGCGNAFAELTALYSNKPWRDKLWRQFLLACGSARTKLAAVVKSFCSGQANKGDFSLPPLAIICRLAQNKVKQKAMSCLLQHRHTSGADALFGLSPGMN